MTEPTTETLSAADFNPDKYVKELCQKYVGGQELQRIRTKIQSLSDETNGALKKNVYQNYMQFIDTAKEISHLEGEMYQLSHMLTEQRSLLAELASTSILGDVGSKGVPEIGGGDARINKSIVCEEKSEIDQEEEARRHKLTAILEKVEGCISLLDPSNRNLIHEGDLLELESMEYTALQRIYAYLFNDCLMLTTWIPNRRGPMRYKFQKTYECGKFAVVNIKDMGNVKLAFKLLAFPDMRVFQCSSNSSKKEWFEKFDQVKRMPLIHEQLKREGTAVEHSPSRSISLESPVGNPFLTESDMDTFIVPEWLIEACEELDVFLAQRHHEDALQLLERAHQYINDHSTSEHGLENKLLDIKHKMESRKKTLIDVLIKELEVSPEKSLQGGLRAARRPVRLLKQLDKSTQACELFLQLCSSMLKVQYKRVKREGSITTYVRYLVAVIFTNMTEMAEEFLRAFPNSPPCTSAFVVWISNEFDIFAYHLIKQLFFPNVTISILAECINCVRSEAEKLWQFGVDMVYRVNGVLRSQLCITLENCHKKLVDAVRLRAAEDKWRPTNLVTGAGLTKCLNQHMEMGLDISVYVTGNCWIELTSNTLYFIKMYVNLVDDCLKLSSPELQFTLDEILYDVFFAQLKHVETSLNANQQPETKKLIRKNAVFLLEKLLPLVQNKYIKKIGFQCNVMGRLKEQFCTLCKGQSTPITKYSSTEYL